MRLSFGLVLLILSLQFACAPFDPRQGRGPFDAPATSTGSAQPFADATTAPSATATLTPTFLSPATLTPSPSSTLGPTTASFSTGDLLKQFPLITGTTWVYSYIPYQGVIGDPTRIVTATYVITETVIRTADLAPYLVVDVKRERSLVSANPNYVGPEDSPNNDDWLAIQGNLVFQLAGVPKGQVQAAGLLGLAFDLPLKVGKSWCPENPPPMYNPQCNAMGRRTVTQAETITTPAGRFEDCYKIAEEYNSGGVTNWFCNGVGVVAEKYDHSGSRFGFEQMLTGFTKGAY